MSKKFLLISFISLIAVAILGVLAVSLSQLTPNIASLPTLMVLPSITASSGDTPSSRMLSQPSSAPTSAPTIRVLADTGMTTIQVPNVATETPFAPFPISQSPVPNQVAIHVDSVPSEQAHEADIQQIGDTLSQRIDGLDTIVANVSTTVSSKSSSSSAVVNTSEADYFVVALDDAVTSDLSSNDDFNAASLVTILPYHPSQDTSTATTASDDPIFTCTSGQKNNTVWYRYTTAQSGTLTVNSIGSNYDTVLGVWTGSRGNLTSRACNDDYNGVQSQISLVVTAGTTYFIEAASYYPGGGTLKLSASLIVPPAPPAPSLIIPSPTGTQIKDVTPTFSWNPVTNGTQYHIQVSTNSNFTSREIDETVSALTFTPATPQAEGLYYWRVQALNINNVASAWSTVWRFTIDTTSPAAPLQNLPADNPASWTNNRPTFTWSAVTGGIRYELQLDTVNPPLNIVSITTTSYIPPAPLLSTTYYWRVRALDAAGNASGWSAQRTLTIGSANNTSPVQYRYTTHRPTLMWNTVTWAYSYQLQIDDDSLFRTPNYINNALYGLSHTLLADLPNGIWYWRMRACSSTTSCGTWTTPAESFAIVAP